MPKPSSSSKRRRTNRGLLRSFVETFPPLKLALRLNDFICYLFSGLVHLVSYAFKNSFRLSLFIGRHLFRPLQWLVSSGCSQLSRGLDLIPAWRRLREERQRAKYQRLDELERRLHHEPVPYERLQEGQQLDRELLIKRSITYYGGMLLALLMYIFVYFVLVKHHSYATISVAMLLLLVYLLLIENSHNIRSILMLCLPIMFTNRGRALVFCTMLTLLAGGPIRTTQQNVKEIHSSLNCCKQYLIVQTDKQVGESVISKLVRVEEVVLNLVQQIKLFAHELKQHFDRIIELALETEQFIVVKMRRLKEIMNICNKHTNQLYTNCMGKFNSLNADCRLLFSSFMGSFCTLFGRLDDICGAVKLPQVLCELPQQVVEFYERTIGRKLAEYVHLIENEFYVEVDVKRSYAYNLTKSKSYSRMIQEIKFDVEQKFWYVHLVRRVFNLISLILVLWILSTATIYHMHYLSELEYDNMYLDERLQEIEQLRREESWRVRKRRGQVAAGPVDQEHEQSLETVRSSDLNNNDQAAEPAAQDDDAAEDEPGDEQEDEPEDELVLEVVHELDDEDSDDEDPKERSDSKLTTGKQDTEEVAPQRNFLFPMKEAHERQYLKPFSIYMNKFETSKLYWSSLIWLVIVGYIMFFVLLDFALYQLVDFLVETLRAILFTSELPLIDLETRGNLGSSANGTSVVKYNRTYLSSLRKQRVKMLHQLNMTTSADKLHTASKGTPFTSGADGSSTYTNSTIQAFYDRLMESIESDIPDDVAILESLEGCLPSARVPNFQTYKTLVYLALFTFCAVIVEAYALRTRHCIANLYYPRRARQRALWLYRRLLSERAKYEEYVEQSDDDDDDDTERPAGAEEAQEDGSKSEERQRRRKKRRAAALAHKLLEGRIKR